MWYAVPVGLLGMGLGIFVAIAAVLLDLPYVLIAAMKSILFGLGIAAGIAIALGIVGMFKCRS